ncbi:hypothetical protein CLAIMM_13791 isoform 2, partial [Cladophialophora immunda]
FTFPWTVISAPSKCLPVDTATFRKTAALGKREQNGQNQHARSGKTIPTASFIRGVHKHNNIIHQQNPAIRPSARTAGAVERASRGHRESVEDDGRAGPRYAVLGGLRRGVVYGQRQSSRGRECAGQRQTRGGWIERVVTMS